AWCQMRSSSQSRSTSQTATIRCSPGRSRFCTTRSPQVAAQASRALPDPEITGVTEDACAQERTLAQVMLPEDANPRGNVHGGALTAYVVFVAIDEHGRPTSVRPLKVTTREQRRRWEAAEQGRARRIRRSNDDVAARA